MAVNLKLKFKAGDKVHFRVSSICVHAQYLPKNLSGIVKAAYLDAYGVALREELDIEFQIPDVANRLAQPSPVELRKIPADQVEHA